MGNFVTETRLVLIRQQRLNRNKPITLPFILRGKKLQLKVLGSMRYEKI